MELIRHSDGGGGAGGWGTDPLPGQEPQAQADHDQQLELEKPLRPDYTIEQEIPPQEYKWSMTGSHISVSSDHDHADLFDGMNHADDTRPHAWGTVEVSYRWEALWSIAGSNMSIPMVEKRLKRYSTDMGWKHMTVIDSEGQPLGEKTAAADDIPPEPGTTPIPPNHVRLYHYTGAPEGVINREGLRMDKAKGETYGEPNVVWASAQMPDPYSHRFAEFSMAHDDPRWDIGRYTPGMTYQNANGEWEGSPEAWAHHLTSHKSHVTFYGDIKPEELIAVHEPWHQHLRYMQQNLRPDDDLSWLDEPGKAEQFPAEHRAYQEFKKRTGSVHVAEDPGAGDAYSDKEWTLHNQGETEGGDYYGLTDPTDDSKPRGPIPCSECGLVFPDFGSWRDHVERTHINPQRSPNLAPHPVIDLDQPMPADFNTLPSQDETIMRQATTYIRQHFAVMGEAILGPIPFVYDIEGDKIFTGHPGERHADIKGQFTPGGIVEGLYLPNGKLQFRTDTDMPYTLRHMVRLWQYMHRDLEVKSLEKLQNGKVIKLASANIAHKVRTLALSSEAVQNVFNTVGERGNVYVVGGAVRDAVLGRVSNDIDLMVQGIPTSELEAMLGALPGRVDLTGKAFGVFRYKAPDGEEVEIALPRTEHSTGEGHRDFDVQADPFLSTDEDLSRRDFTANSMCVNLRTGELIDPFHGAEDLKAGRLRTTWPGSFAEDPLRTVRALSAVSRFGLEPTSETRGQMTAHAHKLPHLPSERIQEELDKVMKGDDPARAIKLAQETGVLDHVFPELKPTYGFDQRNKYHRLPLDEHLREVLHRTAELSPDRDLRLAALLHDIGKPGSFWQDDEGYGHYYQSEDGRGANHEDLGAQITRAALTRLKYPNARINRITHLVQHHMFAPFETPKAARRRISQVGHDHIQDLLTLREADSQGKGTDEWENKVPIEVQRQLAQQVMDEQQPTGISSLVISGNDLIGLGIPEGPQIGQILKALADKVIDDPKLNNRHDLLAMAQQMLQNRTANILDPIQQSLDPKVFDQASAAVPKLKPRIANWAQKFVKKTMMEDGWPDPDDYLTMVLTGSLTTYQYADHSDFDVSLWIDAEHLPEYVRADLIKLMISKCDGTMVPGTTHPIQCFVVDGSKFKMADLYKPGLRSGFNITENEWIVLPERSRVHDVKAEYPSNYAHARLILQKFILMTRYYPPMVKKLYRELHQQRLQDQQAGLGDFSESNIAYKLLRNFPGMDAIIERETGWHLASEDDD